MELYLKISFISIFSFFLVLNIILSDALKHSNWWRHKLGHT